MGISLDQIHPDDLGLIEEIECIICRELSQVPHQCANCKNAFCFACIQEWKKLSEKCPFKCTGRPMKYEKIGAGKLAKYRQVRIRCSRGCGAYVCSSQYLDHISLCGLGRCANFEQCGGFIKYALEGVQSCSQMCHELIRSAAAPLADADAWTYSKLAFCEPLRKLFPLSFDRERSSKAFAWLGASALKSADTERKYKSVLCRQGFLGGVHSIRFVVEGAANAFKVGVTKNQNFNPESNSFCDFEEGFGFYSLGQTRNNSNFSGLPCLTKLDHDKRNVVDMLLSMGDGKLFFSVNGAEEQAFQDWQLKEGPLFVAMAFAEKVNFAAVYTSILN